MSETTVYCDCSCGCGCDLYYRAGGVKCADCGDIVCTDCSVYDEEEDEIECHECAED